MSSYSMFNGPEPSEEEIERMDVDDYSKWAATNEKLRNSESRIVYISPGRCGSIEIHGRRDAERFIQHLKEYCDKVFSGDSDYVDESLPFVPNVPMKRKKELTCPKLRLPQTNILPRTFLWTVSKLKIL